MSVKTSRKLTIVALIILILSALFVLGLLFTETLSKSTKTGNDMGEGIAIGCTGAVLVVVFLFALIVKFVSIIFGVSSLFVKRRLASILILGVLTCILAIVSLICSIYCLAIFQGIQNGSSSASLMNVGLIFSLVSDVIWLSSIILNTVAISKMVKTIGEQEEKQE